MELWPALNRYLSNALFFTRKSEAKTGLVIRWDYVGFFKKKKTMLTFPWNSANVFCNSSSNLWKNKSNVTINRKNKVLLVRLAILGIDIAEAEKSIRYNTKQGKKCWFIYWIAISHDILTMFAITTVYHLESLNFHVFSYFLASREGNILILCMIASNSTLYAS